MMVVIAGIDVGKYNLEVSVAESRAKAFRNTAQGIGKLRTFLGNRAPPGWCANLLEVMNDGWCGCCGRRVFQCNWPIPTGCGPLLGSAATKPRPTCWMPRSWPAMAGCFPSRRLSRRNRNVKGCRTCCAGVSNWWPSGCRNGTDCARNWRPACCSQPNATSPGWIRKSPNWTRSTRTGCANTPPWASGPRCTVPGVGPITAATLVAELPELGHWDDKALTALVGLAPWSRDSGQKQGHRSIRGGRGVVRRILYLAALSAIRTDATLRDFNQRLRQRGKAGKVALVAVMRKLLLRLNSVARRGTPWNPEPLPTT